MSKKKKDCDQRFWEYETLYEPSQTLKRFQRVCWLYSKSQVCFIGSTTVHSQFRLRLGKDYIHPFIYTHMCAHIYVYLTTLHMKHAIYDDIFCVSVEVGIVENMCVHIMHWQKTLMVAPYPSDSKGEFRNR